MDRICALHAHMWWVAEWDAFRQQVWSCHVARQEAQPEVLTFEALQRRRRDVQAVLLGPPFYSVDIGIAPGTQQPAHTDAPQPKRRGCTSACPASFWHACACRPQPNGIGVHEHVRLHSVMHAHDGTACRAAPRAVAVAQSTSD
eukprot:289255-Chlamydomonas_euryale.AAC.9